jgi:5-methylcytosine-specific restriction endonuclease McrA
MVGTTTQRGLGWSHQKRRAYLLRNLTDGTPCAHCGQPMYRTQKLEADHTLPRSQGGTTADRLLHMRCNRQLGGQLGRAVQLETQAFPVITSRDW